MKQRMYNVFYKYLKVEKVAKIVTVFSYSLLKLYYLIVKVFLLKKNNRIILNEKTVKNAISFLESKYNHKKTESEIVNKDEDKNITLSIIMPAYNVEKYIRESINSVLNQNTSYSYELLIINDGSSDKTKDIIESINNPNLRTINQENQGLSGARNTGLNNAVGKYVLFIDSDDVLENDCLDKMLNAVINSDADISIGGYYLFYNNDKTKQMIPGEDKVVADNPREIVFNPGFAWGKIYKRELFYNVRFPMGAWFEDTIICSVIYRKCKKMAKISDCIYGYRQNWDGISKQSKKSYKSLDHIWVMQDAINQANKNGIEDDSYLYELCFGHFSSLLYRRIRGLDENTKKNAFIVSCDIMNDFYKKSINSSKKGIEKDLEIAFKTCNYKLWKLASFVV